MSEIKEVIGKIGSSEIPTDPMPVEAADMIVVLKNKSEWTSAKTRDELAEKMNAKLMDNIPGVSYSFQQPIQMRFNELMTGAKQDVVIKIFGEDLNKLTQYAKQVGAIAKKTDGAEDVYVEEVTGLPQIVIKFHRDKIAQFGLNIEDINKAIRTAFAGESAGLVFEAEKRFDLVVRLEKDNRKNLEDIRGLFVTAPKGNQIPIEQLADIDFVEGPNQIQRDDAKRRIIIGFNIRGRDVASIVKEMQQKIDAQIKFEAGYYTSYGGQFKNLEAARARLSFALPVALLLIFAILFFTFNSLKQSLLIFTAIPLSAIGGVFALWIRGMPFSISAGVGFIALFGVAVLNGIVLIAEFNRLKNEGMTNLTEIVKQGTAIRLRPVIMTALVASLGFLPMALSHGSGAEVQKPLATVVIGGLLTATLLTLLVLPILYIWVEKIRSKKVTISPTAATIILLLVCSFTNAQIPPISLEQALQQAVQNNKSITTGKLEIDYQKKYKKSLTEIPKTNIGLQYGQYNSINKTDNHFTASQIIPFPTVFAANKALGNSLIKGSELKLTVTQNELQYQVKQVYGSLQYLYAHKQLLIQQDSIYKGFVKSAALRYKTGEGNLLAKITAETQSNEVKYLLLQNHTDIQIYLAQLETLLASKESIVISDTAFSEKDISIPTDTAAINTNPFLAYLQQQIDIATKQKKAEAAKSLPDITAAYFNQSLIGFQNVNGTDKYFDGSKRFQGFQVGVGIAIFNGTGKAKVKAAEVNKQIAGNNYELNQTEIKSKYQQAVLEYLKNKNSIAYYKTSALPNADLILKQTIASYSKGEIGYPEYLMGIKNAIGIKETYLKALHQYNQSIINIEYLSGKK